MSWETKVAQSVEKFSVLMFFLILDNLLYIDISKIILKILKSFQ